MESVDIDESVVTIIDNEYDYSNCVPTVEGVSFLVKYLDSVYKNYLRLTEEDEKKNEQFKFEYKSFNYKKTYESGLEIRIKEKSFNSVTCNDWESFLSAVDKECLKGIIEVKIRLDLSFKRGKGENLSKYENSFLITFAPYDISFVRKSNHNEVVMNKIEKDIREILNKFPVMNTIFCTK